MDEHIDMAYEFEEVANFEQFEESELTYAGKLGVLTHGCLITIKGLSHADCEYFSMDLHVQESATKPSSVYKFTPKISQKFVVCTFYSGNIGRSEEVSTCVPFPFKRDQDFEMKIFLSHYSLYYQVNSVHYYKFRLHNVDVFRSPSHIKIKGLGVSIFSVYKGISSIYPVCFNKSEIYIPKYYEPKLIKWDNPCVGILQESLSTGIQILISGRIKKLSHSFSINFQSTANVYPEPDIGLHISVRFMETDKTVLVLNSLRKGIWGNEQVVDYSWQVCGTEFELKINCEDDFYSLWNKQRMIALYQYTMPPHYVRVIKIEGDVCIYQIHQTIKCNNEEILCDFT